MGMTSDGPGQHGNPTWLERIGIPRQLRWGYLAVLIFMIGDGVESNYLEPYLTGWGLSAQSAGLVISVYGAFVALGSWFSGVLSNLWGPRRVMRLGAAIWLVFEVLFLVVALPSGNELLVYVCYGLRGVAYPLFAYAFLLWIQLTSSQETRGSAAGWFWFAYSAGLPTVGSAIAAISIPFMGPYATFWLSFVLVAIGGLIGSFAVREARGTRPMVDTTAPGHSARAELLRGISVLRRYPRTGVAALVRMINTTPYFGFFVFLPSFFSDRIGLSTSQYLALVTFMGVIGILADPVFGKLSDRIGWRHTIAWAGGVGCAAGVLVLYWVPQLAPGNYAVALAATVLYGIMLAGYIPLSALLPALVPEQDKGNAMGIYSLAAGLSTFVGPLTYVLLDPLLGHTGVVLVYAAMYVAGAVLTWKYLVTDEDPGEQRRPTAVAARNVPRAG
ncbi:MFS transporter [Saccharopolyspora sp. NFXS83]|uniref:MFS transporter n=1 Tax=Saccharopolyspora sp. NFXS83 TaxID=2993560 RepID=UPI00224A6CE8|nr:MFS transporter [Saccharopolyspora sp. NFXS83]MCX2730618.1 MFS transporter [Saccharopolyspora sp. NFXS83]